jgi:hypothetical protein
MGYKRWYQVTSFVRPVPPMTSSTVEEEPIPSKKARMFNMEKRKHEVQQKIIHTNMKTYRNDEVKFLNVSYILENDIRYHHH